MGFIHGQNSDGYYSFVSISCHGRRFAIEDPKPYDLLPVDDAAWDQGVRFLNTQYIPNANGCYRRSYPTIHLPYVPQRAVI
jgi:hypothetical protein